MSKVFPVLRNKIKKMLPSYDITSEKKIFCFTNFSRNDEDFEVSQLKKF